MLLQRHLHGKVCNEQVQTICCVLLDCKNLQLVYDRSTHQRAYFNIFTCVTATCNSLRQDVPSEMCTASSLDV